MKCEPTLSLRSPDVLSLKVSDADKTRAVHGTFSAFCFPNCFISAGISCQVCFTRGPEQVLSAPHDAPTLPGPLCAPGQQRFLCILSAALPHHPTGVCAFCKPEEGQECVHFLIMEPFL